MVFQWFNKSLWAHFGDVFGSLCRRTACRCSGKLFFQNNNFMHQFSQKRKTAPRCRGKLFVGGPRGEKRVPKIEIIVVKRWVDCEDTQRKECAKATWSGTRMAVQRSMKAKSVSWKTAPCCSDKLFFKIRSSPSLNVVLPLLYHLTSLLRTLFAVCLHSLLTFWRQLFLFLAPFFHPLDPLKTASPCSGELFCVFVKIDA